VRSMLEFITKMPHEDAGRDRCYTVPFHCDTVFSFNKTCINALFFRSAT